jgi:hypothetical protein
MKLPKAEIARIDPLLVLSERKLPKPKTKPATETPGTSESGG